jgi:putative resolvase
MKLRIAQAAKELGVAPETLRRWEAAGKIEAERTANGHRRYDIAKLRGLMPRKNQPSLKVTIGYARVSSRDQKEDLIRQVALLESYCAANGWNYEVIQDLGSGLNYNKRGLRHLIKRICNAEIERLVVNHKDRLLRFGSELIFSLCEHFGVEVVVINAGIDGGCAGNYYCFFGPALWQPKSSEQEDYGITESSRRQSHLRRCEQLKWKAWS